MAVAAIRFDLRRAPFSALSEADLHREMVGMSTWADERGFAAITISEHHGVDFISAPLAMAGVLLGSTKRAFVMLNALLLPLHDPVRVAEDVATLDLMSGGRFTLVAGLGYRHEEFAMAGVDRTKRGAILEEYVQVILKAWSGEPFEWRGRTIQVTPTPTSPARALMLVGGSVKASARRAARLRLGFCTMSTDPVLGEVYAAACKEVGFEHAVFRYPTGPSFVHVAEDPDKAWAELAPFAVYDAASYSTWQTGDHDNVVDLGAVSSVDDLKASGMWQVLTPDECVELAQRTGSVALHPLMGGIPPELGWQSLQLFVDAVQPRL
jgi:alkanesulfonate monooxygenase SsuD/methylene tetrahydromethanopterin reductase-like flavin-dependent oxidoreductase (luciferase family)